MCGPSRKSSRVLTLYADKALRICSEQQEVPWFKPSSSACCRSPFLLAWALGSRSADLLFLCSSTGSSGYPHLTFVVFFTVALIWAPHLLPLTRALLFFLLMWGGVAWEMLPWVKEWIRRSHNAFLMVCLSPQEGKFARNFVILNVCVYVNMYIIYVYLCI